MTDESATRWSECHHAGSAEAERREFEGLAELMLHAQLRARRAGPSRIERPVCVGSLAGMGGARLAFSAALTGDLRVGFARPGAAYPVQLRFSHASGDGTDLLGLALRIAVSEGEHHDLLAATSPASHARDARQFVSFTHAMAGGRPARAWIPLSARTSVSQMPSRVSQAPEGGPDQFSFIPRSSAGVPRIAGVHSTVWILAISAETISRAVWYTRSSDQPPQVRRSSPQSTLCSRAKSVCMIPGTLPDHHCVPYSLTEEFTTVYRMHPLIPDDYVFLDGDTGRQRGRVEFAEIAGDRADEQMRRIGLRDVLYSFGIGHPGAITLHNFPRALQRFRRDGEVIDLSVVDIMRSRARRVPRYNAFRRGLRMAPVTRWEDMTASPETNRLLREVYGRIDCVDTVVGLLGETPPAGFGFSDTAFRIFLLMASRRLQSDRFLTVDFRPEIYSPLGMDWIERNTICSVLLRHCPELAPVLPRDASAFAPWRPVR